MSAISDFLDKRVSKGKMTREQADLALTNFTKEKKDIKKINDIVKRLEKLEKK